MADEKKKKRKSQEPVEHIAKRSKGSPSSLADPSAEGHAGKVRRVFLKNFMCHDAFEIQLNSNVNFIVGRNGSGKSAILTALVVGLGGKATVTNRGSAIKEFVKKGKKSGFVEITLVNEGVGAYKPEVYGDSITIVRNLGYSSGYRIKNARGAIIATKKAELECIISHLNIQVDNPISVLNQDVSREFLVTAGPTEKYALFIKATNLERIRENYQSAQRSSEEAKERLAENKESLLEAKKQIDELETHVRMLESIDDVRAQHDALEHELFWSIAISEEHALNRIRTSLEECQNNVQNHKDEIKMTETTEKKIKDQLQELEEKIQNMEKEAEGSMEAYAEAKKNLSSKKEAHTAKARNLQSLQANLKRTTEDIASLRKEIQRLTIDNQADAEKLRDKEELANLQKELVEIEDMLQTQQSEKMNLERNTNRLIQEQSDIEKELEYNDGMIRQQKRQISNLKQVSDNAVAVFGPKVPKLLTLIQKAYEKGQFKEIPRGPLGLHIEIKDAEWKPAVESFLGHSLLHSFCVDNARDAKILNQLMENELGKESMYQVIVSKFYHKIHDVSQFHTRASGYSNLFNAIRISDPVVANCLIDQREIECVLLISTSEEACEMLSNARKVPPNCKQALTKQGDTFYPVPNYKSYSGQAGMKARYLQVSTTEAIQVLEEELKTMEAKKLLILDRYQRVQAESNAEKVTLRNTKNYIAKLCSRQMNIKNRINTLLDKCPIDACSSVAIFTADLDESLKKFEQESAVAAQLREELTELEKEIESVGIEAKRCRDFAYGLDTKLESIKSQIRKLENKKQTISINLQTTMTNLRAAEQTVQRITAQLEKQQRVCDKAVDSATVHCPRIDTARSSSVINRIIEELKCNIKRIEGQCGSKKEVKARLKKQRQKYSKILALATTLEAANDAQLERLVNRRRLYKTMKKTMSHKIEHSFKSILALRNHQGRLKINFEDKQLKLEVQPAGGTFTQATALSGGERTYATVAFILALWECVELPFYFLDEFDVFMDKVHRRVILDIMLHHTRQHPNKQYAFLTPLDIANIRADDYITIHQLAEPERAEPNART